MSVTHDAEVGYNEDVLLQAARVSKIVKKQYAHWLTDEQQKLQQIDVDHALSRQTEFCDTTIMSERERITRNQRLLLECEQTRVMERRVEIKEQQRRQKSILSEVEQMTMNVFEERIQHFDILRLLNLHTGFIDFASFAYSPRLNFQRISEIVTEHHSLSTEVLELVKSPSFNEQMGKAPRQLNDAKIAVGHLGIETCKTLFPILMAKPLLNWSERNTKSVAPKMWQHLIVTANVTRMRLASIGYKEPDEGVLLAVLRSIGQFAISNQFTFCFEEALVRLMQRFRDEDRLEDYFVCADLSPSLGVMPQIIDKWEKEITQKVLNYFEWPRHLLHIKHAVEQDIYDTPVHQRSAHGVILGQAQAFTIYDAMQTSKLFDAEYTAYWFAHMRMDGKMVRKIKMRRPGKFLVSM